MNAPVFSVTVPNGTTYNIERASAQSQKSLLLLVGSRITIISAQPNTPKDVMGKDEALIGMLMSLDEQSFDKVCSLLLHKVIKHGDNSLVTIDNFQSDLMSFMHVVAGALRENLSDFFTWLQVSRESSVETQ